jgi:hypothetical protein
LARPLATEWSTRSSPTDDTSTIVTLDNRVNTNVASTITTRVVSATGNPPGANESAVWTSGGTTYLQTRPTANGHTLLMATLRNDSGSTANNLNLIYTLTEGGADNGEEVLGHRVYWSLTGAAGSWTPIEAIDGSVGWKTAAVALPGWAATSNLFLLWADDNGDGTTDRGYQIDDLTLNIGAAPLFVHLNTPVNGSTVFPPLNVSASTFGNIAASNVSFYTNGVLAVSDSTAPYSAAIPFLPAGTHTIYATANNGVDPTAYSSTNTVTVLPVIRYTGGTITEDFNGMTATGINTPAGWYVSSNPPVTSRALTFSDGSDPANVNVLGWNYGTTGDPDRALGTAPTGTDVRNIAVVIQNATGSNITAIEIHFDGEVWRNYTNPQVTGVLSTRVSINGGEDWFSTGLFFAQPLPSYEPMGAVDGNAPANRTADIHGTIVLPSPLPHGAVVYINWRDDNDAATDGGLAIDNFSFRGDYGSHERRLDFETLPDGSPAIDRMVISNQFAGAPFNIRFQYEDGTYPQIARVGTPYTAFKPNDNPAVLQGVGSYFLTDDGLVRAGGRPPALIVTFAQPTAVVSGAILDVDGDQSWRIDARNNAGVIGTTLILSVTNNPNSGNGIATYWSIVRSNADISSLRIAYTGGIDLPGFAFDNFSTTNLPTPVPARLTTIVSNRVSLGITGTVSGVYSIEHAGLLPGSNWAPVVHSVLPPSFVLPSASFTFTNFESTTATQRFYRAVGYQ